MEGAKLDRITRTLAAGAGRRTVVGALIVGALGLGGRRSDGAAARFCRPVGRRCRGSAPCCDGAVCADGICEPLVVCGPTICRPGEVCCNASCGICTPPGAGCITDLCESADLVEERGVRRWAVGGRPD